MQVESTLWGLGVYFLRLQIPWGSITVFPVKLWTPEKISGVFIVSWPVTCKMKLQKVTGKLQQPERFGLVTHWHETKSWPFFPLQIFNFTIWKYWNCSFSISELMHLRITVNNILLKSDDQQRLDSASESTKIVFVGTTTWAPTC